MRAPVFTVTTPVPIAPDVTLWDNTWNHHIQVNHPEMVGKLSNMQATLSAPTAVCTATNPDYMMFINHQELNQLGHPLVVCVSSVDSSGKPAVVTAYHGKKYKNLGNVQVIWP